MDRVLLRKFNLSANSACQNPQFTVKPSEKGFVAYTESSLAYGVEFAAQSLHTLQRGTVRVLRLKYGRTSMLMSYVDHGESLPSRLACKQVDLNIRSIICCVHLY